jgi:predicted transcriptional regulator
MARTEVVSPTRQQIVMLLWREPGLSTRHVARAADVPEATAAYHLHRLERAGQVVTERVGRVAAHYPNGWGDARARKLAALSTEARIVVACLKESERPMRPVDVERRAGLSRGSARWALELAAREGFARRVGVGKYEVVQ